MNSSEALPDDTSQEIKISVGSRQWAAKQWGHSHNPTVLAFHGWLDNAASFNMLAPVLAERFHVIAFDFPGHGYSDHLPESQHYHYADLLAESALLVKQYSQEQPVVLLGHSLGAAISVCLAALYPQLIKTCVLLDALGPVITPVERTVSAMLKGVEARHQWEERVRRIMRDFDLAVAARMKGEWPLTETASRALCERGTAACDGGYIWRADPRWKLPSITRLCEPQVQAILKQVQSPVLLAWASQGLIHKIPTVKERQSCLKQCIEEHFEGGHHFHMFADTAQLIGRWIIDAGF